MNVTERVSFNSEPLFADFRKFVLQNFDITVPPRDDHQKVITFVLRKRSEHRHIHNIEDVQAQLGHLSIN
jgi:hypothetical protein